jgi:hypothetical protein
MLRVSCSLAFIAFLATGCEASRAAYEQEIAADGETSPLIDAGGDAFKDSAAPLDMAGDGEQPPDAATDVATSDQAGEGEATGPCSGLACTKSCATSTDCYEHQVCVDTAEGCCSECRPRSCDPAVDECPPCSTCENATAGHPGQCVPIPCPAECTGDADCLPGEHCETYPPGCCGRCVVDDPCALIDCDQSCTTDEQCPTDYYCWFTPDGCCSTCKPITVPAGCCDEDSDCPELDAGVTLVCRGQGQGTNPAWGVCVAAPEAGWCWADSDCGPGLACHGAGLCGCQLDCDAPAFLGAPYAGPGLCVQPGAACAAVDPAWVEEYCDAASVIVFDGQACRQTCLGCCHCEPFCDYTFQTFDECRAACGGDPLDFSALYVNLQTDGGFTGQGGLDLVLEAGLLHVVSPWGEPSYCSAYLSADTFDLLHGLASAVDWAGVAASYKSPDNPFCCCDQFIYSLHATFVPTSGTATGTTTEWCDESMMNGSMPQPLLDLLDALRQVAQDALESCAG